MPLRLLCACLLLAGCATTVPVPHAAGIDVLLIGEQHDADSHRGLQQRWVEQLARGGTLAALAVEMAERGASTDGLPAHASEEQVRQALRWTDDSGWPWERYGPAVMAAVRAGVPVTGANLPRGQMRQAMNDKSLDRLLPGPVLKAQQQAIRSGHCELLPEHQVGPMTRVQIARDVAMAGTVASLVRKGSTVVLIAGSGHVQPDLGVPRHLPKELNVKPVLLEREETGKDYCAELRRQQP